ncbi:MAG: hypothetical protein LBB86_09110, partial [Oscillospiraceae bacterium]|nr:hypothetical protein [Oscillospiraceae bacterium]
MAKRAKRKRGPTKLTTLFIRHTAMFIGVTLLSFVLTWIAYLAAESFGLYTYETSAVGKEFQVFRSTALRRLFPNPDIALLCLWLALFVGGTAAAASYMSRKLSRHMRVLTSVTDRVGARDLDYVTPTSSLYEINQVLISMEKMRSALKESLQTQWAAEQERRQQLAALTHDIHTPLTIVRGNAELLQLSGLDGRQSQYGAYIMQGAERIERCVAQLREVVRAGSLALRLASVEIKVLWTELNMTLRAMAE